MKRTQHYRKPLWLLVGTLLSLSAMGQGAVTKSGTEVVPREAPRASAAKAAAHLADGTAGTYLVVTPNQYLTALQPLLQWKRMQGFRVETMVVRVAQRDSIRSQLRQRHDASTPLRPAQRYVLLVGDVEELPTFFGQYTPSGLSNSATDLYYGEYTGDYLPEAMVGRLPARNADEAAAIADKIIRYEQGEWADSYHSALLAAGSEERQPAPVTTNGQVHYLATLAAAHQPQLDTLTSYNTGIDSLTNALRDALAATNALVSYTGHCLSDRWNSPSVTYDDMDSLLPDTPTLFVNNCCRSNAFNGDCLGEALLRRPMGGAVGVIGATNETLWTEDCYWAVGAKYPFSTYPIYDPSRPGALDTLLTTNSQHHDPQGRTLGAMLQGGCTSVTRAGSPFDAFYWETYCLLGDPSLVPFLGSADNLLLQLPDTLRMGMSEIAVNTTPYARISITSDSTLLGTAVADNLGHATVKLFPALCTDSIAITATRPGARYLTRTARVDNPTSPRWVVTHCRLEGRQLHIAATTIGSDEPHGHHADITQLGNDTLLGARLLANSRTGLQANGTCRTTDTAAELDYAGSRTGLLCLHLILSDSNGNAYDTTAMQLELPSKPLIEQMRLLTTDGESATRLIPRTNYLLTTSLGEEAYGATASLNGNNLLPLECPSDENTFTLPCPVDETHMFVEVTAYSWDREEQWQGWLLPCTAVENFETGDLSLYPWQQPTLYPWSIDSNESSEGRYSLRSAPIDDNQQSVLALDVESLAQDSLSFHFKTSAGNDDWLYFYVDGRKRGYWAGNNGWQRHALLLSAGRHHLEWIYRKSASGSSLEDAAWVDEIRFPLCRWDSAWGKSVADTNGTLDINGTHYHDSQPFELYPNPANTLVTFRHDAAPRARRVILYNALGQVADEIFFAPNSISTQYSATHLRFGTYTLVLHDDKGSYVQKMVITH